MSSEPLDQVAQVLGLDSSTAEMRVLGTLVRLCLDRYRSVTVKQIIEAMRESGNGNISENWVYRCLYNLDRMGFVGVDRIRQPHLYYSDVEYLARGLEGLRRTRMEEVQREIQLLDEEMESLRSVTPCDLCQELAPLIEDVHSETGLTIVEGQENVMQTAIDHILQQAGPGDEIWHTASVRIVEEEDRQASLQTWVNSVRLAAERGASVRIMVSAGRRSMKRTRELVSFVKRIKDHTLRLIQEGRIQIRIDTVGLKTYRAMGLNRERMIMHLSDLSIPDLALIAEGIQQNALIADAKEAFDRRWKKALDIREILDELDG